MEQKKKSAFLKVLFVLYVLGVLFILFFARVNRGDLYHWELFSEEHLADRLQWIPFATIQRFFAKLNAQTIKLQFVVRNIAVNLLLFIPMGAMLPILFPKRFDRFWKTILFIALFVFTLEILQFVTNFIQSNYYVQTPILNCIVCIIIAVMLFLTIKKDLVFVVL